MAQINVFQTPDQIPQAIVQFEAEAQALNKVLAIKQRVAHLLDDMEGHVAANNFSGALICYVEIQRTQLSMELEAIQEKLRQNTEILGQLRSPIHLPRIKVSKA